MVILYKNYGAIKNTLGKKHIKTFSRGKKPTIYCDCGAGFDCETTKINGLAFVYVWQFAINNCVFICRDPFLLPVFLDELLEVLPPASRLIVGDANLSYEWQFFRKILGDGITDIFAKSKRDILSFEYKKRIEFREILGAFGKSLSDVAKRYCSADNQKMIGDLNYNKLRGTTTPLKHKEYEYIIKDVTIIEEVIKKALDIYIKNGLQIPLTQTAVIRQEIRENIPFFKRKQIESENKILIGEKQEYLTLRQFLFSGGLTHSNVKYVGKKLTNIKCKDLTSAYPAQLNQKYFPCGKLVKASPDVALRKRHYILHIKLEGLRSKSTHSTISIHKCLNLYAPVVDNGRVFSASSCELWVNEIDLHNIKKIYTFKKIYIAEAYFFTRSQKCPKYILEVMNEYYKRKNELKRTGYKDTLEYKVSKEKVNSIYGMLCTSLHFFEYILADENEVTEQLQKFEDCNKSLFNHYLGYWTTAYTRQRLIDIIAEYPDNVVQYDTDSIYYIPCRKIEEAFKKDNEKYININKALFDDSDMWDLGTWSDEGTSEHFMALGSKRYIKKSGEKVKITFAGIGQEAIINDATEKGIEIFEYMKDFNILCDKSNKLGCKYIDEENTINFIDCAGRKEVIKIPSCAVLFEAPFKASLSEKFIELQKMIKNNEV